VLLSLTATSTNFR